MTWRWISQQLITTFNTSTKVAFVIFSVLEVGHKLISNNYNHCDEKYYLCPCPRLLSPQISLNFPFHSLTWLLKFTLQVSGGTSLSLGRMSSWGRTLAPYVETIKVFPSLSMQVKVDTN